jgi:hypothetical protein
MTVDLFDSVDRALQCLVQQTTQSLRTPQIARGDNHCPSPPSLPSRLTSRTRVVNRARRVRDGFRTASHRCRAEATGHSQTKRYIFFDFMESPLWEVFRAASNATISATKSVTRTKASRCHSGRFPHVNLTRDNVWNLPDNYHIFTMDWWDF